jgi:hypothetical protein
MDLAKSAMLVSVSITNGGLLGERRDKTATALVQKTYSIADRRSKASKYLIDRNHPKVKAVVAASQRVRECLYRYSMPWGDDKSRLLAVNVHEVFAKKIADAEHELREAWKEYLQVYPALIAASERELGKLFDRSQYPTVLQAEDMFSYKLTYWPIPSTGHFVAEIAQEAVNKATAEMSLEIETRLKNAAKDIVERGRETVRIFVERLESYKSKADGKIIRDSLVNNLRHMSQLIAEMNITDNEEIYHFSNQMLRLSHFAAEDLRNIPTCRKDAITIAKRILDQVIELDTVDLQVSEMVSEAAEYDF